MVFMVSSDRPGVSRWKGLAQRGLYPRRFDSAAFRHLKKHFDNMKRKNEPVVYPFEYMRGEAFMKGFESGVTAGVMKAFELMGVARPRLRREEAERLVRHFDFKACVIDKWVDAGMVEEYRGDKRNSPREYNSRQLFMQINKATLEPIRAHS